MNTICINIYLCTQIFIKYTPKYTLEQVTVIIVKRTSSSTDMFTYSIWVKRLIHYIVDSSLATGIWGEKMTLTVINKYCSKQAYIYRTANIKQFVLIYKGN